MNIFCARVIMPLRLEYICAFMDTFVHHTIVYELTCLYMLYNAIIICTSF